MTPKIFVNLPVKNLDRSLEFFKKLGFGINPLFTDQTAACLIVSEDIYIMLLTEAKFQEFTPKAICDAASCTEVLVCLTCASRDRVDELVGQAVAAGGTIYNTPMDYGFMYAHGFQDLDSHIWELIYLEPAALNPE
ncbi:MAG: glyoxalase/bleomycin resistance/extradiol dioxygenase family protein [Deltaproteobacteria bacterium]|nr:glyoxalase/bleomycin resistance/extradiol dioxygenase family protein [Deltaproteobacteria bacterium]